MPGILDISKLGQNNQEPEEVEKKPPWEEHLAWLASLDPTVAIHINTNVLVSSAPSTLMLMESILIAVQNSEARKVPKHKIFDIVMGYVTDLYKCSKAVHDRGVARLEKSTGRTKLEFTDKDYMDLADDVDSMLSDIIDKIEAKDKVSEIEVVSS